MQEKEGLFDEDNALCHMSSRFYLRLHPRTLHIWFTVTTWLFEDLRQCYRQRGLEQMKK